MFCAVVKFTKEKIKVDGITNELTPQACRVAKQSTENKENSNYVDDPRDIEDILVSLSQLQDEGVFDLEGEEKEGQSLQSGLLFPRLVGLVQEGQKGKG